MLSSAKIMYHTSKKWKIQQKSIYNYRYVSVTFQIFYYLWFLQKKVAFDISKVCSYQHISKYQVHTRRFYHITTS